MLPAAVAALVAASVLVLPATALAASSASSAELGGVGTVRYGGADRYATSLLIAEAVAAEAGGSLSSVVVVSGQRWTDAVVAAPIAGSLGAAVLMTPPGELRADALEFLERTGVTAAVVIGPESGGGAHGSGRGVGAAVLAALGEAGITAERVVGADRFSTSVAAAKEVAPGVMPGLGRTAIVASGEVATVRVNSEPLAEPAGSAGLQPWGFAGAHEIIHALGLPDLRPDFVPHAYDRSRPPAGKRWTNANFGPMNLLSWFPAHRNDSRLQYSRTNPDGSTQRDYAGRLHALEMLAWSRWQLGWLDDSQVRCIEDGDSAANVALTPIAQPGADVAMAAVQLSSHEVIVVESRRRLGYDRSGPHPMGHLWTGTAQKLAAEGVLVYTVDTLLGSGWVPTRVAGGNDNFEHDDFPVLQAGQSVTVGGYTITVTADNGDTHTVSISKSN